MALIKSYRGLTPKWGKDCYFSENATIVGDVQMGDQCSIWFNAVVRGDVAPITIGDRSNVQDGSCIHVTHETYWLRRHHRTQRHRSCLHYSRWCLDRYGFYVAGWL